ncbi:sugar porter family MFS transporter [Paraglaciecola chathamensis]|uniref:Probable metabolite transport protein csbC n=1 Tax=Paraglaciecola chathamensis S18K6 TaxID=1127672 RepID=A0AAV3UUE4_9ALTE|nr:MULTISPECIES: sugar porter family MFS transporter [Paraglaciecola]MBN26945.1 MFS transporter [Alteromonadaceae bacterium]GAC08873.1 probable metabolite transport protein csbC [Paraglaciecola chathamensis S18K6]|tara:strand:- start:17631 stop:18941 length:1311 start_codon:yes stop_codon:yes gene_type:complete
MNKIVYWSFTVAIAGFLFGFDTAVISGADQSIQALWETPPLFHGLFVMSSALWGTVLGALTGNWPCDRLGRKKTLVLIGVLYLLSALGSALAQDPYTFAILRFIGGVGVGVSSIAVPAYISEIAPAKIRGRLVATYQFQIVFGILVAFLSNYLLSGVIVEDWRMMLGVEALPALVYFLMVLKAPESPRWLLLHRNDETEARRVFIELQSEDIEQTINAVKRDSSSQSKESLFKPEYRFPVVLAFLLAAFNQLSGINFIIYYAPRVFDMAGLDGSAALLSTAGVGLVNLIFTMLGVSLIDRIGRKSLMYIGSFGYLLSLATVTWAFSSQMGGTVVVGAVFVFIAAHAIGQGAVIWVFIAEIFPNSVRSKGQSLGSGTHWVFAALITLIMPQVLASFSAPQVFGFFTFAMFLQLLFVRFLMPETKGRTLEDVSAALSK